jgi:streptogramin lyase
MQKTPVHLGWGALATARTGRWIGLIAALIAFVVMAGSAPSALAAEPPPNPNPPTFTHTPTPCPGNGDCNPPTCSSLPFGCGSAPYSVAFDRDGNAWWTESRELNTIGRMDAKTHAVQLFPVPADGVIDRIVLGPDGNMWFSDQGEYYNPQPIVGHIGRILTHAPYTITEFVPPTVEGRPLGLTVGSDHNLWFTEYISIPSLQTTPRGGNKIGRLSPFGTDAQITAGIKEFPLPTPNAGPLDIAAGPDGNLWFTEASANQIGRITTHGTITEYPLPTGGAPIAISKGPDGNVWFTDRGVNSIGRILTTDPHTVSLFPVPGTPQALYFITTGPDGNMWFTDPNGNDVGRVLVKSPNTVTVYPDPLPGASPRDIKCGPDGNLWVTEQGTHTLGQVHLTDNPATAAVYSARCRVDNLLSSFGM